MKNVNTELSKKQLLLFEPFLDKELTCTNEFLTYIDTTSNNSNIIHKNSVTSLSSNDTQKITNFNLKNIFNSRSHIMACQV